MEYNVSDLLMSPLATTQSYDLPQGYRLALDEELVAVIEHGQVRLERTTAGIHPSGHVSARVSLSCARCLAMGDARVASEFAEDFAPCVDAQRGHPLPAPDDDLIFMLDRRQTLEMDEALRQNLVPALPIQPLCQADCAGLCPTCGANRNTASCGCETADVYRPFAELAELVVQTR
jgi:uncharacterized metal-binding protein YceD (DUF177 family)